jgi:hypothetical protein
MLRELQQGIAGRPIQINAIIELERLYPGFTLTRMTRAERERTGNPHIISVNQARFRAAILNPVPVAFRCKGPIDKNWQSRVIDAHNAAQHFNGTKQNIGVVLGQVLMA